VRRLLRRLHLPRREQLILWRMAAERMSCDSFKNILLLLLQSKSEYGVSQSQNINQNSNNNQPIKTTINQ
jgi:hypothetical protein